MHRSPECLGLVVIFISLYCAVLDCLSGYQGILLLEGFSRLDWRTVLVLALLSYQVKTPEQNITALLHAQALLWSSCCWKNL